MVGHMLPLSSVDGYYPAAAIEWGLSVVFMNYRPPFRGCYTII